MNWTALTVLCLCLYPPVSLLVAVAIGRWIAAGKGYYEHE